MKASETRYGPTPSAFWSPEYMDKMMQDLDDLAERLGAHARGTVFKQKVQLELFNDK